MKLDITSLDQAVGSVRRKSTSNLLQFKLRHYCRALALANGRFTWFNGWIVRESAKKSPAIIVAPQPQDRALSNAETEGVSKRLVAEVERATGGVLRG
jgi:hypothetical protein